MATDQEALDLLRRHGPRLRLNMECFPGQLLPFHVSVWSEELGEWVVIARAKDPAGAILEALQPAEIANIYGEASV